MKKIRILQVCNTDFYANQFLAPLLQSLSERGYEIDLICEGKNLSEQVLGSIRKHYNIEFPKKISIPSFIDVTKKCRKILIKNNYTLCNCHNRNASIPVRFAFLLPHSFKNSLSCYTAHGFYFHDGQTSLGFFFSVLLEFLMSFGDDLILSQSNEDVTFFSKFPGIRKKISHIGNGIKTDRFYKCKGAKRIALEKHLFLPKVKLRVIFVGRIVRNKGIEDLIDAFSLINIPDIQLLLVGGVIEQESNSILDEIQQKYKNLIDNNQLLITGMVSNVEDYLAISDIFVSPSYREGMPRSTIEAQASALPSVVTNIRGNREIISQMKTGIIVDVGKIHALKDAILFFYMNKNLIKIFGEEARKNAVANYNEIEYVEKQINYMEDKINEKC